MKKRILAMMVALAMVITLTGCGNKGGTVQEDMSNQNLMKMAVVHDGWVYGAGNSSSDFKDVVFTATKLDGSEKKVISDKAIPTYVNVHDDHLYYIMALPEGNKLLKCDMDGKNEEEVLKGVDVGSYQIVGDKLYYQEMDFETDMLLGIYQCDLDGKNKKVVLKNIDTQIVSPYVDGNTMYYQDLLRDDGYFSYDLKTKKEKKISEKFTYMLAVDGENAYGVQCKDSIYAGQVTSGKLVKINLESGDKETLAKDVYGGFVQVTDKYVYFIDNNEGTMCRVKKSGGDPKTIIEDGGVGNGYIYGNEMVYITYDETGYFGDVYATDINGKSPEKL